MATSAAQAGSSSSPQQQEPVIRLHGYDVLMDVGTRPNTHVYKVRRKLHDDVPVYMDSEEPCYALKCIDLNDADLPAEGKQQAVRETQALLKLQHPNVVKLYGVEALLLLKPSCLQGSRKSNSIEGIVNRPNHHRDGT